MVKSTLYVHSVKPQDPYYGGVYPQDKAYLRDKKIKMVCMSTGYRYPLPLSGRTFIPTLYLLEIGAYPGPGCSKSKQDGGSCFYAYHLGDLSTLKRCTSRQNQCIKSIRMLRYMYHIQIWFNRHPNNNN